MTDPRTAAEQQTNGVFYVDAPDGYIALAVFLRGRRVARFEVAADCFSEDWVRWFDRWLRRRAPSPLKIIT